MDEKISLWYGLVLRRSLVTFVRNVLFETKLAAVTVLIEWKSTICLFFHRQIGGGGIILDALMRTSCIFSCEREKSWWVTKGLFFHAKSWFLWWRCNISIRCTLLTKFLLFLFRDLKYNIHIKLRNDTAWLIWGDQLII